MKKAKQTYAQTTASCSGLQYKDTLPPTNIATCLMACEGINPLGQLQLPSFCPIWVTIGHQQWPCQGPRVPSCPIHRSFRAGPHLLSTRGIRDRLSKWPVRRRQFSATARRIPSPQGPGARGTPSRGFSVVFHRVGPTKIRVQPSQTGIFHEYWTWCV